MIDTIVFDMGNVLIRWNTGDMLRSFPITAEQAAMIKQELFQGVEWYQQDRGIITEEQVVERVCARLPEALHEVVRFMVYGWYERFLVPMPGVAELVRELKGEGYRILLLSNASRAVRGYFDRVPGSECFDGLMLSAEERLMKPQHEIYEALYARFGVKPENCVFIDDSTANVEGAILTGMPALIFRGDVARLRRELAALGVRCAV